MRSTYDGVIFGIAANFKYLVVLTKLRLVYRFVGSSRIFPLGGGSYHTWPRLARNDIVKADGWEGATVPPDLLVQCPWFP